MSAFPFTHPKIMGLAYDMIGGFKENPDVYPAPPVSSDAMKEALDAFIKADTASVTAHAAATAATTAKKAALANLKTKMKQDIRYAEGLTEFDHDKLKLIGWGARQARTPLPKPGQPMMFEVSPKGVGTITLNWKKPKKGGKPASYKIQRRAEGVENWEIADLSVTTNAILKKQPRGVPLEYRVIAINKGGESTASNFVRVVL